MAENRRRGAGRVAAGVLVAGALAIAASCGEEQIEEREVPRGTEQVPEEEGAPRSESPGSDALESAPAPGAAADAPGAATGESPWTLPAGWTEVPGERPMRLATFEAPDEAGPVEIALTRFPGRVGGELANMNRWRGQMGLEPLDEGDLESAIERFEAPGFEGYRARIEGVETHMLAAGVYEASEDRTWFVRATAPAEAADRIEDDVWAFARSIAGLASVEEGEAGGGGG